MNEKSPICEEEKRHFFKLKLFFYRTQSLGFVFQQTGVFFPARYL